VIALKEHFAKTGIYDVEMFTFTDNFVSDHANAQQPHIVRVSVATSPAGNTRGWKLHVIHIAEKCIQQGTGGLSREEMLSSVMGGVDMLLFVTLGE
jgi:hypothetical protein